MRGIKYSANEKQRALDMWLKNGRDILYVAKHFKCTERTLWRWKAKYDGSIESLENGSSVPHTPSLKAHTKTETEHIIELFKENPDITYSEALGILRAKYAYNRTYFGFYRFVIKNKLRPVEEIHEAYVAQPYNTPEMLGLK